MNINDDYKLNKLIMRKNLSESRIKTYHKVFNDIYKLTNKSPTELINEAKEEEVPFLKKDKIIFPDIEDRKITEYLYTYYKYLENRNIKPSTIMTYINALRSFYSEYEITLPKNFNIKTSKVIIRKGDIPNIKDIRKAVEFSANIRNKAIILLMASSGIRSVDIRNFKISDFTNATKEYHNSDKIDDLLDNRSKNIIPTWYFIPKKTKKEGNVCVTFNTPECSELIITYLKKRTDLTEDSPLFESTHSKKMNRMTLIEIFAKINDDIFGKINNQRFFKAHSLRKFFISTCNHNTSDINKVNLLAGHSSRSSVHDAYNEVNTEVMKRFYTPLIPYLSIRDTRIRDVKSSDYMRLEKELEETNRKLQTQKEKLKQEILADLRRKLEN